MKKISLMVLVIFLISVISGCKINTSSTALKDISKTGDNKFTCTYEGVKHDFIVYLPDESKDAPMVMLLHGYGESAEAFRSKTGFHERSLGRGYAAIYVGASSSGWNSGIAADGNDDVAFLKALAGYLQDEYHLSKDKTYVTGFSNGGFMVHRIAMEAQDVFHGCVSVAGKMPKSIWQAKNDANNVSYFQVTGEMDDVVPKHSDKSADSSIDPAIEDVMDYWVSTNGLSLESEDEIGNGSHLKKYSSEGKKNKVWDLTVKDGKHSWPDDGINGFVINDLILDFFDSVK